MQECTEVGRLHSIETFGALDGPGIRFVVFLQGCPLRCQYCHNPDTWKMEDASEIMTVSQLTAKILDYQNFIQSGGVTFSGGEPLLQAPFCLAMIRQLHQKNIHVALDTSGMLPLSQTKEALKEADLILLDIKALEEDVCRELTGFSPEPELTTLYFLREIGKPVWIRHVLVPGITLLPPRLEALADYLTQYPNVERVELLPFHKMGEYKWEALGYAYRLQETPEPEPAEIRKARDIFLSRGLPL